MSKRWFAGCFAEKQKTSRQKAKPCVEALEDRVTPATFTVNALRAPFSDDVNPGDGIADAGRFVAGQRAPNLPGEEIAPFSVVVSEINALAAQSEEPEEHTINFLDNGEIFPISGELTATNVTIDGQGFAKVDGVVTITGGDNIVQGLEFVSRRGGIVVNGASGTTIVDNIFDLIVRQVGGVGIHLKNATDIVIGSVDQPNFFIGADEAAVIIEGAGSVLNQVLGNVFGAKPGESGEGLELGANSVAVVIRDGAFNNFIGLPSQGNRFLATEEIPALDFLTGNGVLIENAGFNTVQGNLFGILPEAIVFRDPFGDAIDADPLVVRRESRNTRGIRIENGSGNQIGGSNPGEGNVISASQREGILISGDSRLNKVFGNTVGLTPNGLAPEPNLIGISLGIDAVFNQIGGTLPGQGNIISGNDITGLQITGDGNVAQGNLIGTDITGEAAIGNEVRGIGGGAGILIRGDSNQIGGTAPGAGNVISGTRQGAGISLQRQRDAFGRFGDAPKENVIQGNLIGTDRSGLFALPNDVGIEVIQGASNNIIGGTAAGAGNLISGNTRAGIVIGDRVAENHPQEVSNRVEGNFIGANATGQDGVPNGIGIEIVGAQRNSIGGTAAGSGNLIAFNLDVGIQVSDFFNFAKFALEQSLDNSILGNSIFLNGQLGIDLVSEDRQGAFVTFNDEGDADQGPNNLQNFPVLTLVESSNGISRIRIDLESTLDSDFRVELFANDQAAPLGFGEGQKFLGFVPLFTNALGTATDTITILGDLGRLSATATNLATGSTSEFSEILVLGNPAVGESNIVQINVNDGAPPPGQDNNEPPPEEKEPTTGEENNLPREEPKEEPPVEAEDPPEEQEFVEPPVAENSAPPPNQGETNDIFVEDPPLFPVGDDGEIVEDLGDSLEQDDFLEEDDFEDVSQNQAELINGLQQALNAFSDLVTPQQPPPTPEVEVLQSVAIPAPDEVEELAEVLESVPRTERFVGEKFLDEFPGARRGKKQSWGHRRGSDCHRIRPPRGQRTAKGGFSPLRQATGKQ